MKKFQSGFKQMTLQKKSKDNIFIEKVSSVVIIFILIILYLVGREERIKSQTTGMVKKM